MARDTALTAFDGFSLIEVLVVLAIVGTLSAITIPVSTQFLVRVRADSATLAAVNVLEAARTQAIAERRNLQVRFDAPDRIRVARVSANGATTVTIADLVLENHQSFTKFPLLPDTPDRFGFATALNFTGPLPVMFTSEGAFVDANGDVTNATILIGDPTDMTTARAITIFGMAGLVRNWKWSGEWAQ